MIGKLHRVLFESELRILSLLTPVNVVIECSSAPEKRFSLSPFWESLFSLFVRSGWPTSFCVCVPFSVICSDVFLSRDIEVRLVYILTCLLPLRRKPLMEVPMVIRLDRRPSFMYFIWLIFFLKHFITYI